MAIQRLNWNASKQIVKCQFICFLQMTNLKCSKNKHNKINKSIMFFFQKNMINLPIQIWNTSQTECSERKTKSKFMQTMKHSLKNLFQTLNIHSQLMEHSLKNLFQTLNIHSKLETFIQKLLSSSTKSSFSTSPKLEQGNIKNEPDHCL
jgi:hypothetical protein